jgi:plasmid maintenance system antidote protein VapI
MTLEEIARVLYDARQVAMASMFPYEATPYDAIQPVERSLYLSMARAVRGLIDRDPREPGGWSHVAMLRDWLDEGHTSAELARAAGISQKHVSQILYGKAVMRPATIVRVAEVLGCDPYTLACGQAAWGIDWALADSLRDNA